MLETNTELRAEEEALAYRDLWRVERAFREIKSNLELRPIYHWTERRIRGHIMVCFLAFVLEVVMRKLKEAGCEGSYREVIRDLERLKTVEARVDGRRYLVRTELEGRAYEAFGAVGMRVPGRVLELGGEYILQFLEHIFYLFKVFLSLFLKLQEGYPEA